MCLRCLSYGFLCRASLFLCGSHVYPVLCLFLFLFLVVTRPSPRSRVRTMRHVFSHVPRSFPNLSRSPKLWNISEAWQVQQKLLSRLAAKFQWISTDYWPRAFSGQAWGMIINDQTWPSPSPKPADPVICLFNVFVFPNRGLRLTRILLRVQFDKVHGNTQKHTQTMTIAGTWVERPAAALAACFVFVWPFP